MAQNSWFYTFPNGKKYEIGIYHSQEGHVVIYCEGEIIVIDFNVMGDKQYSFFIENKLLNLTIKKNTDASFAYELSEEIFTTNLAKGTEDQKKYRIWAIFIFLCVILLVSGLCLIFT